MTKKQAIKIIIENVEMLGYHLQDDPEYDELWQAIKILEGAKQ